MRKKLISEENYNFEIQKSAFEEVLHRLEVQQSTIQKSLMLLKMMKATNLHKTRYKRKLLIEKANHKF